MKLNIIELRDMVARAVRQTVREAKKAKLPAERSEESVIAQRDRQVRALPGYAHSVPLDMSKPLGKRSRTRRQGASNIGNWTSESHGGRPLGGYASPSGRPQSQSPSALEDPDAQGDAEATRVHRQQGDFERPESRLMHILSREGIPFDQVIEEARALVAGAEAKRRAG